MVSYNRFRMTVISSRPLRSFLVYSATFGAIILLIQFFNTSVNLNVSDDDPDSVRLSANQLKIYQSLKHLEQSDGISLNNMNISIIDRTPGYAYHDGRLISFQNNLYLEKYRLHYCKIDKNMGSAMQAIFCYIDKPEFMADFFFNQTWGPGLGASKNCGISTSYGDLRKRFEKAAADVDFFQKNGNIIHFSIVRHPIKRFISAFVQVCQGRYPGKICFNCRDLYCFLPKLYAQTRLHTEHTILKRYPREHHFYPQSWYCDFDRKYDFYRIYRYDRDEKFTNSLLQLYEEVGVDKKIINDVAHAMRHKEVAHATYMKSHVMLKQLMEDSMLLEYVFKIYYLDFLWFGYDLDRDHM